MSTVICTDFEKAFDRVSHTVAMTKLIHLGVRPAVISWICDFLTGREYSVGYHDTRSAWHRIKAGVPQGTRLGPLIFLVLTDDLMRNQLVNHWKYVDDMSIASSQKVCDQDETLRHALSCLEVWCEDNYIKLNPSKCVTFKVSFSKTAVVQPDIEWCQVKVQQVNDTKILGITIQDNLKWDTHIEAIVSRANRRLFMLRSLKPFSCPPDDMITVFTGFIRPVLEYACPVWHSSITQQQAMAIERVQKRPLRIILSNRYISYQHALTLTNCWRCLTVGISCVFLLLVMRLSRTQYTDGSTQLNSVELSGNSVCV